MGLGNLDGLWGILRVGAAALPTENLPPEANASCGTCKARKRRQSVQFSSAGSSDSDGSIVAYLWDFGDDKTSTDANPSHTYRRSRTFTVTLTVTDNDGATDSATVTVEITR
jgi:chitodextrinase